MGCCLNRQYNPITEPIDRFFDELPIRNYSYEQINRDLKEKKNNIDLIKKYFIIESSYYDINYQTDFWKNIFSSFCDPLERSMLIFFLIEYDSKVGPDFFLKFTGLDKESPYDQVIDVDVMRQFLEKFIKLVSVDTSAFLQLNGKLSEKEKNNLETYYSLQNFNIVADSFVKDKNVIKLPDFIHINAEKIVKGVLLRENLLNKFSYYTALKTV